MKLTRLTILGCDRLADLTLTVCSRTDKGSLTLVSGPAGSGKTALLEVLIAAKESWGPSGARLPYHPRSRDGQGAKLSAEWSIAGSTVEAEAIFDSPLGFAGATDDRLEHAVSGYSVSPAFWKLEYMHEGRAIERGAPLPATRAAARIEIDPLKYAHVEPLLVRRSEEDGPAVIERLSAVLAGFGLGIACAPRGGGVVVTTSRGQRSVSSLARSEQQLFLLLAAPLAFGLDNGMLFIDTLEQGLPAAWVAKVAGALRQLLPDTQILATTRTPEIVGATDLHIQLR